MHDTRHQFIEASGHTELGHSQAELCPLALCWRGAVGIHSSVDHFVHTMQMGLLNNLGIDIDIDFFLSINMIILGSLLSKSR